MFTDATPEEINKVMKYAWDAFHQYRKMSLKQRAGFMRAIGIELEIISKDLILQAMSETNLSETRLRGELDRTILQLNQYGAASESGQWLEARIDTALSLIHISEPTRRTPISYA